MTDTQASSRSRARMSSRSGGAWTLLSWTGYSVASVVVAPLTTIRGRRCFVPSVRGTAGAGRPEAGATGSSGGAGDLEASRDGAAAPAEGRLGIVGIFVSAAHPRITGLWMGCGKSGGRDQPSYSKPILRSTRYSTISPSSTTALDFTTSTVLMLRTVRAAVVTAWRAASLHDC